MTNKEQLNSELERIINRRLNLLNCDVFDLSQETRGLTNEIMDTIAQFEVANVSEEEPYLKNPYGNGNSGISEDELLAAKEDTEDDDLRTYFPINLLSDIELAKARDLAKDGYTYAIRYIRETHPELGLKEAKIYHDLYLKYGELEEVAQSWAYSEYHRDIEQLSEDELDCLYSGFIAGAKWQKQQILNKTIDAEVESAGCFIPLITIKDKDKVYGIKFGDKVKLVLFK